MKHQEIYNLKINGKLYCFLDSDYYELRKKCIHNKYKINKEDDKFYKKNSPTLKDILKDLNDFL